MSTLTANDKDSNVILCKNRQDWRGEKSHQNCAGYLCDTENSSCTPFYYFQIVTRKIFFLLPWLVEALSENFFLLFFWRLIHHLTQETSLNTLKLFISPNIPGNNYHLGSIFLTDLQTVTSQVYPTQEAIPGCSNEFVVHLKEEENDSK